MSEVKRYQVEGATLIDNANMSTLLWGERETAVCVLAADHDAEVARLTALIPPNDWHNIDDVQEIRELKRQLAAETVRADFAWKNTREIDKARMADAKRLAEATRLLGMVWAPGMPEGVHRQVRAFLAASAQAEP